MLDGSCRRSSPLSNHSFFTIGERKIADKAAKEGLSQESSRLLSYLTNSYHKAVEISQEEWFNETKDAVAQWVKYLLKKDPQAFIFVQKAARFSKRKRTAESYFFDSVILFSGRTRPVIGTRLMGKRDQSCHRSCLASPKETASECSFSRRC